MPSTTGHFGNVDPADDLGLTAKLWESDESCVYLATWAEAQRLPASLFANDALAIRVRACRPKTEAPFHYLLVWDRRFGCIAAVSHASDGQDAHTADGRC